MLRLIAIFTRTQSSRRSRLVLTFFALALLWLWQIAQVGGYSSWAVHALFLLAIAIGFMSLKRNIGIVSVTGQLLRKFLIAPFAIRLARITRVAFKTFLRVPMHVVLSLAYLIAMFGTVVYLMVGTS